MKYLFSDIKWQYKKFQKAWEYFKFGWNDVDFDACSIYDYLHFKLPRILKWMENGYSEYDKKTMHSIKLAIKLLNKICSDDYRRFYKLHEKKWGEVNYDFVKSGHKWDNKPTYTIKAKYPKANTEEQKEQADKEFYEAMNKDDRQEERDKKILFRILEKYMDTWWD